MEECDSLDAEMTELQEFQCDASEAISQDDEDEVEELRNSLREVVQDQSVKPKLQCLMVDPSFSMVTVQSEDSGIVWETASSRCSTPWASETSSISEGYGMEGSGAAGKITILFDEDKIVRRRTRSGGRSSRLGDRLSRPGSSRSASALGTERPEMAEVSVPNVKQEKTEAEPDLEEIKNKDQQLFSLISEGYEILNIRVPSKLPTVDEEESTELQDNLSYLDQTPKIRSRNHHNWKQQQNHVLPEEEGTLDQQEQDSSPSAHTEPGHIPTQKESTGDIDYFEKFTLLDEVVPGEQAPEVQEKAEQPAVQPEAQEQKPANEAATDSTPASEESFVFVTDVDIVGEHLDEVFYGEGAPADELRRRDEEEAEDGARMRLRRESSRSMKGNGSVLFGSEETTLTPIYISPGPPKIIDPILLEEPTAMSFMYSDLYEDAIGERQRIDEEFAEAENVAPERFYERRLSDSEAEDYLEKFILKDETPTVEIQSESEEDKREGRMMWSQSKFEMTGCLTRVDKEEDEDQTKAEVPKTQEISAGDKSVDILPAMSEEKRETITETEKEREEIQHSMVTEEHAVREASEESGQESKLTEDQTQGQETKDDVKRDKTEPPESGTDEPLPKIQEADRKAENTVRVTEENQRKEHKRSSDKTQQTCPSQNIAEKMAEVPVKAREERAVKAPVTREVPQMDIKSEIQTETTERSMSEEADVDTKMAAVDEKEATEAKPETPAEVSEPVDVRQEMLTSVEASSETETSVMSLCEGKKAAELVPEDAAPIEIIADCDGPVHAVVEVTEKAVNEKEIQTQVQIDLQEVTCVETADVQTAEAETEHKALMGQTAAESRLPEVIAEGDEVSEAKPETSSEATKSVMPEKTKTDSDEKYHVTDTSAVTSLCEEKKAAELVPEDAAPIEIIADCDDAVHAVVEVTEKAVNEKEIQTQVQIDLQEVTCVKTAEGEKEHLVEETAAESRLPELIAGGDQESEAKPETSSEATKPVIPEETKTDSDKKHHEILESPQQQQVESVAESESDKLMTEVRAKTPTDTGDVAQEIVNIGDELILLVPKGKSVEMDIDIGQWSEKITSDAEALHEPDGTCEHLIAPEDTPALMEETKTETQPEPQLEIKPEIAVKVEEHPTVEEAATGETKMEEDLEENESFLSPLRSFTPLDDLSVLQRGDMPSNEADVEQKVEMHRVEDVPEPVVIKEDASPDVDLHREDIVQKIKEDEEVIEGPEEPAEELEYEVISKNSKEADVEQKVEMHKLEDAPEPVVIKKDASPDIDLHREDTVQKIKQDEEVIEGPEEPAEELEYEVISKKSKEADVGQKVEMHKLEDAPEPVVIKKDASPDVDLHREDTVQKIEQDEGVVKVPEEPVEELEYEVISKKDTEDMPEPEIQRDSEEPRTGLDREDGRMTEERMEAEMEMEMEMKEKESSLPPEEDLIEDDYEIIDAEEESQARLAAELEGMDWFCLTCGCLLSEDDCASGEHRDHEVTAVDKAYEEIKEKLSDWIAELQGRSENIEDLVSELELAYNSVEDQCVESEAAMQVQNEEMMAMVMEQYNNMSVSMEEEKKAKLEQLYDQIVSFQDSIDSAKTTLETTAREAETDARSPEDIFTSLKEALDSAMSLELGPRGLLVFEDYAKGNTSSSHLTQRKGIPVPQKPTLQPQEPGSATSTSVTVYWKVNPGDIIDCFQVYCMEDPQGAVSEEYRVTVKESYCVLEELEPDKTYKVWVMAVNYTGCSLPSERLAFTTAPSVPVIDTERCTVTWDSATLRWQKQTAGHSYTLEYCRQYELEGEGLRSISGIAGCEQRVLLQPNENYLFYIKAVNEAGASEQSEAALISTKGTRFHLLRASAHPALELSLDQTTLHYCQDVYENTPLADKRCPSILGELLPARGHYYWETVVSGSTAYRLGVACNANRDSPLGENSLSWCLQCVPAPSGCRYQLLHNDVQSSVFVIEMPERVGTLLDYQLGRLSFYNAQSGQLLGAFSHRFAQPCHPALALEMPGSLEVSMVPEVPEFTKDS